MDKKRFMIGFVIGFIIWLFIGALLLFYKFDNSGYSNQDVVLVVDSAECFNGTINIWVRNYGIEDSGETEWLFDGQPAGTIENIESGQIVMASSGSLNPAIGYHNILLLNPISNARGSAYCT